MSTRGRADTFGTFLDTVSAGAGTNSGDIQLLLVAKAVVRNLAERGPAKVERAAPSGVDTERLEGAIAYLVANGFVRRTGEGGSAWLELTDLGRSLL
jgi:hypothetical protein